MASLHSQGSWSTKDTLRLLESMENNLPSNDSQAFQKAQADLDWGRIAFAHFTGEMCRLKWLEISHKLRKFRTLTELVLEAKEQAKHPQKSIKYMKHPDFPKRPLTAYLRFYKEQRAQYCQMHPHLNNKQVTRILAEKYRQLPEEVRQRYVQEFQKEKEDFEEKVAQFRDDHQDGVQYSKQSGMLTKHKTEVPQKLQENRKNVISSPETDGFPPKVKYPSEPPKPPMNGFHKFQQDSWSSEELRYLPFRERMVEICRCWQRVPQSMKENYRSQAEAMQKQYWVDLDAWLRTLSPEEYAAYKEAQATCGKRKCRIMTEGPGPKFQRRDPQSPSSKELQEVSREKEGLRVPGTDSSETVETQYGGSQGSGENLMEDGKEDERSSEDGDESSSSCTSLSSDFDSI